MALFGPVATLRAQALQTPGFAAAFAYVEDLLRPGSGARARLAATVPGAARKIELAGGVFAMEQVYQTKPRVEGFFESHRKYIDVQVIVEGEEIIEVVDASRIEVKEPYNPDRDLITYRDTTATSACRLLAGEAAIFYPVDVHMPTLRSGAAAVLVRKTVVKVPVA
jgi:biofilm protein TabA